MRDAALFIIVIVLGRVLPNVAETTVETILIETTTEFVTVVTDIPQSDVDLAMNLDYGVYSTETFPYINSQYERSTDSEKCYDDYTKCLITQGPAHPVCAMNNPDLPKEKRVDGFVTFNTHCDIYFDNCLKEMRFWRIIDVGECRFRWRYDTKNYYFYIEQTRRFKENLPFFLKKLADSVRKF